MGFLDKLFGKNRQSADADGQIGLTPEQFLATDQVRQVADKYKRKTTLLRPQTSDKQLATSASKFGGLSNLNGFTSYPCCDVCNTPLNFVVQLYKADFPEHYFPEGKDLFQLFRCPNGNCASAYSESFNSDLKMFHYYFKDVDNKASEISLPPLNPSKMEVRVPDCLLNPVKADDYPLFDDYGNELNDIEAIYGEDMAELYLEEYGTIQRTKIGGWPSFTQSGHYPVCGCGKDKEFFFQLSSEDPEEGADNSKFDKWSPHFIMIGDLGNIYYYVCKDCGEQTIESYWDCH